MEIPRNFLFQHLDSDGITQTFSWKRAFVCLQFDCECLYFSSFRWVSHRHCNKKVGFKDVPPPHVLCYCFGYTGEEIVGSRDSRSSLLEEIKAYLGKGGQLCGRTNPCGQNCLGAIQDFLERHSLGRNDRIFPSP